jgi:hypothetical protein
MFTHTSCNRLNRDRGFALVVTLSLMILLTILAVGLLSLSAVSLRGTSQAAAQSEARANARLALMLAIGELQKHTGPDTRITAPADILDAPNTPENDKRPPLTGVWRSWEGSDHELGTFAGRPIAPKYDSKKNSGGGTRFLTWLVSGRTASKDAFGLPDAGTLVKRVGINPHSPPSGPTQWLFQGPPAQSKFLAAIRQLSWLMCGAHGTRRCDFWIMVGQLIK